MTNRSFAAAAALVTLAATPLAAQEAATTITTTGTFRPAISTAPSAETPAPIAAPVTTNAILRAGTPVTLRILEEVSTRNKRARVGQRVRMEVAAPLEINGVVVIPAGALAEGELTSVRNKGMWGKSGHLEARALYLRVNGRQIRLSGTFDDKGVTGTAGVVAAVALVPIAGFFVTGTSAVLPAGGQVPAFIDEDVELAIADARPAPMLIQSAAPMEVSAQATALATPTASE